MKRLQINRDGWSTRPHVVLMLLLPLFLVSCVSSYSGSRVERRPDYTPRSAAPADDYRSPERDGDYRGRSSTGSEKSNAYVYECDGQVYSLQQPVMQIAYEMESRRLYYSTSDLRDCSGIFHRFLRELRNICPHQVFPSVRQHRSSQQLAVWYYRQGTLLLVDDPLRMSHLIKPGAVMFYGQEGSRFDNFTERDLLKRKSIHHVGIVVSVEKDGAGRVVSYKLFHGRSPGKYASVTEYHLRKPLRSHLPPFGNYNQPWVAIAPLVSGPVYSENYR